MSGGHQDLSVIQPLVKDCKEVTRQGVLSSLLMSVMEVSVVIFFSTIFFF